MTPDIPPDPSRHLPTPLESLHRMDKEYAELLHQHAALRDALRDLVRQEHANVKAGGRHPEAIVDAFERLLEL